MTVSEMTDRIKDNLGIMDSIRDRLIADIMTETADYCNLYKGEIPDALEPFIRKKVKSIMDYEAARGTGYTQEVASIKEGDGSITWAQTDGNTKASIYGLSESDRRILRRHRRIRGYG